MEHSLEDVFKAFANGNEMDGKSFAKLAKDCGILDKKLTPTEIDLIFAKTKDHSVRKITYDQFAGRGIQLMAEKKGISAEQLAGDIQKAGGPQFHGTKAQHVKLHDDKTTYTGVYAQGGPTSVDAGKGKITDISQTCDRSAADVRGVVHK
jgi:hypothetical protein